MLNWASQEEGRVWNIWEYDLQGVGQFNYPPLHFYLDKLQYFIAKPLGGAGFYEWLSVPNSTDHNYQQLDRFSFALKFPLILFSVLTGYLIYKLAKQNQASENQALVSAALWLFNPIVIYSIVMMGQNDVMAIVFFLAGWLILNRKRLRLASVFFGLAASVKMFPLVWLPFLLLVDFRISWKEKIAAFLGSTVVYILTLLPFIANTVFRGEVLNSGIERFFIARIDLGYEKKVLLVPVMLMLLAMGALQLKERRIKQPPVFLQATILLIFNALLLFFNHFHPQWFTWLVPFWSIWLLSLKREQLPMAAWLSISAILAWVAIIFLFRDSALLLGMFTPLNADLGVLPSPVEILTQRGIETSLYMNYAHTWLAGLAVILLILWLRGKAVRENAEWSQVELIKAKLQKKVMVPLATLALGGAIFLCFFFAQLLPIPKSGPTPIIADYVPLIEPVTKNITADYSRLNRVDLYFNNDKLQNNDDFLFMLQKADDQSVVWQQGFNGFNTGVDSRLRFNIPIQLDSEGKNYTLTITPATTSATPLQIGTVSKYNPDDFAFRLEYAKPAGKEFVAFALEQAVMKTVAFAAQFWPIAAGFILALALL